MSLARYGEYRDSGMDWVAELPGHWGGASLKWLSQRYSGGTPDKSRLEFWQGGTIPWLNSGAVNDGRICEASGYITQEAFDNSSAKWIPSGALLMALAGQGKTKGAVAQLMFESTCNQSMAAIVPNGRIQARFLYWWLASNYQNIRNLAGGNLRDGLNLDLLGAIPCPLPLLEEQAAIAAFLDRETAKIDALIAEQEKLIALLAEKRQATISHAVTKGLDPKAPMKNSGVAWLEEVPSHWTLPPLYLRYSAELGKMLDASRITGAHSVPYLRNVDVQWDFINLDELPCMDIAPGEYDRYTVRDGDLLVCEGGEVGRAAVAFVGDAIVGFQKALHRLRAICHGEHPRYMFYTFAWAANAGAFAGEGQSTIAHLTGEQLRKYRFPKPPHEEQVEIASFLDAEMARLKELAAVAAHAVALLKERRSALIAAAVTGQIDVRYS